MDLHDLFSAVNTKNTAKYSKIFIQGLLRGGGKCSRIKYYVYKSLKRYPIYYRYVKTNEPDGTSGAKSTFSITFGYGC